MTHRLSTALAVATMLFASATCRAADYGTEYDKKIKASQDVGVLGDGLAGDQVNFYTGATSLHATDVSLPGNSGLPVGVGRRYVVEYHHQRAIVKGQGVAEVQSAVQRLFGDWDLDIPKISTTMTQSAGWILDTNTPDAAHRCEVVGKTFPGSSTPAYGTPPAANKEFPPVGVHVFDPGQYWHGFTLDTFSGSQSLLAATLANTERPTTGGPYHWTTNQDWWVSCIDATQTNGNGQGFLAIGPDGSKYRFDKLSKRNVDSLNEFDDQSAEGGTSRTYFLYRAEYFMLPTRIEDRFGNWVEYTWDSNTFARLTAIKSGKVGGNPGVPADVERTITLAYNAQGFVSTVSDGTRTWQYTYTPGGSLSQVTLPDASTWQYGSGTTAGFGPINDTAASKPYCANPLPPPQQDWDCFGGGTVAGTPQTLYVVHPSGAKVVFNFDNHFQIGNSTNRQASYPLGIKDKTITGPGLVSGTWRYAFLPSKDDAKTACQAGNCPMQVITDQLDPDNGITRRLFGLTTNEDETLLLGQLEGLAGTGTSGGTDIISCSPRWGCDITGNTPIVPNPPVFYRETSYTYVPSSAATNYTVRVGVNPQGLVEDPGQVFASERRKPRRLQTITQQGVTFAWQVDTHASCNSKDCFDSYGNPTRVTRASTGSLGGDFSRTEVTTYSHQTAKWVLGQVASVTDVGTGRVMSQTVYDATTALPLQTYAVGILQQTLTYNADGTVLTAKDGRNNVITLGSWKSGIPQTITYPTFKVASPLVHVSESAVVNAIGSLASTTDELGATTTYGYDAMGRLNGITHPTGDIVAWNGTARSFVPVATPEYDLPANHWKQTVQTGTARTTTMYDARWQPRLVITEDTALPSSKSFVVTRYDSSGRVVFSSYPVGSLTSVDNPLDGVTTSYDALGRVVKTEQASELGVLTSTTEYLTGFETRSMNARGKQTTTRYQVYDQPSTDAPVRIALPQGVLTTITRQPSLGKPLSVTRSGTYGGNAVTATRSYVYDDNERLCKTINPESGATIVTYDAAGNIDWSAEGTALTSTAQSSCATDRAAVTAGQKTTRTYDALNRVTQVTTPSNAANVSSTYDDGGKVTSLLAANPGGAVTTTYTYGTKRGLLTGESSTHLGNTFSLSYGYDANANLKQLTYPDGHTVAYAPDALGRATAVTGSGGLGTAQTYASGITYHPGGAIAGFNYGNGVVHAMTQNARKLPAHSTDTYGAFKVIDDTTVFDQNGNVDYVTDIAGSGSQNRSKDLGYDDLDRLIVADAPNQWGSATYAYDPIDNIRSADQGARQYRYNYNATSNLLTDIKTPTGATVFGFTYDARGNTTAKGAQTYTFDVANRINAVDGLQTYLYDGRGRRVRTTDVDTKVTQWIYSQLAQVVYTDEGRRNKLLNYIYLGNTQVAVRAVDKATSAVSVTYQHTDALGSPVAETPSAAPTAGNTVRHSYAPYGEGYGEPTGGSVDGTGFTGHVMDRGTGLTYMQQRYYDPSIGRFASTDPIEPSANSGGNFNTYWYANNSPYTFSDPDGRFAAATSDSDACGVTGCETGSCNPCSGTDGGYYSDKAKAARNQEARDIVKYMGIPLVTAWAHFTDGENVMGAVESAAILPVFKIGTLGEAFKVAKVANATGKLETVSKVTFDTARSAHIFREAAGHVNPASQATKNMFVRLFQRTASNPEFLRADAVKAGLITEDAAKAGVQAYTWTMTSGRQVWVTVRNGVIQNAGLNAGAAIR